MQDLQHNKFLCFDLFINKWIAKWDQQHCKSIHTHLYHRLHPVTHSHLGSSSLVLHSWPHTLHFLHNLLSSTQPVHCCKSSSHCSLGWSRTLQPRWRREALIVLTAYWFIMKQWGEIKKNFFLFRAKRAFYSILVLFKGGGGGELFPYSLVLII